MPKAGPDKQLCGGQRLNQPPGTLCTQRAGWGTAHPGVGYCKRHGGATGSHTRAAQKEIARQEVARLGLSSDIEPMPVDPREALALELWRSHFNVTVLEALVGKLGLHEGGIYGKTYHVSGIETGEAKPHVLVAMYNAERQHLTSVALSAHKAGVEERRVQIQQDTALLFADAIRGILTDLGVADREDAPAIVRRHLTLISGGMAA